MVHEDTKIIANPPYQKLAITGSHLIASAILGMLVATRPQQGLNAVQ